MSKLCRLLSEKVFGLLNRVLCVLISLDYLVQNKYNVWKGVTAMSKKMEEQQKYIDIIGEIENSYALMKKVRPLTASELKYFNNEFSISASHNSNAIEGNTFTFDETKLLIEKGIITGAHSLRESEDIVGYKQAFDFLYESVKDKKPINEEFIKQVHSFVLRGDEEAGKYRTIQNYVGSLTRIVYTPCPPTEVPKKMKAYEEELQAD